MKFCCLTILGVIGTIQFVFTQELPHMIKYRCWITLMDGGKIEGFMMELRDSTISVATNYKRPKVLQEITLQEIPVWTIQNVALRKTSRPLETALLLGGIGGLASTMILKGQDDDLFSIPGVAIVTGVGFGLPFAALGALVGTPKKHFLIGADLEEYQIQRDLMNLHMKLK